LLTQLDRMRRYPNVLILATSNLSECLDEAFLDRADMKRKVSLPSSTAAYSILKSCVLELQRINLIDGSGLSLTDSESLMNISRKCAGFSGRALRKLPVLAYSQTATEKIGLSEFLDALDRTVSAHSMEFLR